MVNQLVENDQYVTHLRRALSAGADGLDGVPKMLRIVLEGEMWRRRFDQLTREDVEFASFAEFVTTRPTHGLGTSVALVRRIIVEDTSLLDLMDKADQNPPFLHAGNNVPSRPEGNTPEKALRRLRKDRPDLHSRVLAKELTPHGAMVEAGFRRRTLTVPLSVEGFARAITRHLDPLERALLLRLLMDGEASS